MVLAFVGWSGRKTISARSICAAGPAFTRVWDVQERTLKGGIFGCNGYCTVAVSHR